MAQFKLTTKVTGTKQAVARIRRLSYAEQETCRRVVASSALNIQNEARKNVKKDTSRTAGSIRIKYDSDRLGAEIGSDLLNAVFIEFGTRPHPTAKSQAPRAMPPEGVLLDWMRRHRIPEDAEFALRRHIQKHGTEAKPFLFPAYEGERPRFLSNLRTAVKGAA